MGRLVCFVTDEFEENRDVFCNEVGLPWYLFVDPEEYYWLGEPHEEDDDRTDDEVRQRVLLD